MKKYLDLFYVFFKIGLFTFGGGYAMISQIREYVVEKKQWLTEDELVEMITIAESTPGPIAINMATYVGYKQGKVFGSILSTIGVVLAPFTIMFIISLFLDEFMKYKLVKYAFNGINAAVAFLIIKTGYTLTKKIEKKPLPVISFIIVFILLIVFDLLAIKFSSLYYILIAGVIGIIYYSIISRKKQGE